MVKAMDELPFSGTVVIGRDEDNHPLSPGATMGGGGVELELACDPVEGAAVVGARRRRRAVDPGRRASRAASTRVPRMYMKKMAVGPVAKGRIDLRRSVTENLAGDRRGVRPAGRATSRRSCSTGRATTT